MWTIICDWPIFFSFPQVFPYKDCRPAPYPVFPQAPTRFGFHFLDSLISHLSYPIPFHLGYSSLLSCPQRYQTSVLGFSHLLIFPSGRYPQIPVQLAFFFWFKFAHKCLCSKLPICIRIPFSLQYSLYPSILFLSISSIMT